MKKILEDLWYGYFQSEEKKSEQEKEVISRLLCCEKKLLSGLSDEKKAALAEYESCFDDLNDITVKQAFSSGVKFAVSFLLEVLGD